MQTLTTAHVNAISGGVKIGSGEHEFVVFFESAMVDLATVGFGVAGAAVGTAIAPGVGTAAGGLAGAAIGNGLAQAAVSNVNHLLGIN